MNVLNSELSVEHLEICVLLFWIEQALESGEEGWPPPQLIAWLQHLCESLDFVLRRNSPSCFQNVRCYYLFCLFLDLF